MSRYDRRELAVVDRSQDYRSRDRYENRDRYYEDDSFRSNRRRMRSKSRGRFDTFDPEDLADAARDNTRRQSIDYQQRPSRPTRPSGPTRRQSSLNTFDRRPAARYTRKEYRVPAYTAGAASTRHRSASHSHRHQHERSSSNSSSSSSRGSLRNRNESSHQNSHNHQRSRSRRQSSPGPEVYETRKTMYEEHEPRSPSHGNGALVLQKREYRSDRDIQNEIERLKAERRGYETDERRDMVVRFRERPAEELELVKYRERSGREGVEKETSPPRNVTRVGKDRRGRMALVRCTR